MMDDFLKRLLLPVVYWVGAMCLIHLVMGMDPGYRGNWVFVFTGKILWIVIMIFRITLFLGLAVGTYYLAVMAIKAHDTWQEQQAEEAMKKHNEEVAKRNAAQDEIMARKREQQAIEEKKRKDQEFEEHLQRRHLEKYGPRSEDDALAKAMDSIKLGGFE